MAQLVDASPDLTAREMTAFMLVMGYSLDEAADRIMNGDGTGGGGLLDFIRVSPFAAREFLSQTSPALTCLYRAGWRSGFTVNGLAAQ